MDSIYLSGNSDSRRNNLNVAMKSSARYSRAKNCVVEKVLFMELIRCLVWGLITVICGSFQLLHESTGITTKKGKALPLQAWSGPEGSRKLRFPAFMTMAQDGGKFVTLYPQEIHLILISVIG